MQTTKIINYPVDVVNPTCTIISHEDNAVKLTLIGYTPREIIIIREFRGEIDSNAPKYDAFNFNIQIPRTISLIIPGLFSHVKQNQQLNTHVLNGDQPKVVHYIVNMMQRTINKKNILLNLDKVLITYNNKYFMFVIDLNAPLIGRRHQFNCSTCNQFIYTARFYPNGQVACGSRYCNLYNKLPEYLMCHGNKYDYRGQIIFPLGIVPKQITGYKAEEVYFSNKKISLFRKIIFEI